MCTNQSPIAHSNMLSIKITISELPNFSLSKKEEEKEGGNTAGPWGAQSNLKLGKVLLLYISTERTIK